MKKIILGLVALALIFTSMPAMAAGARVPSNLCYFGAGVTNQLVLKSIGTLKTNGGPVKQYGIFGYADTGFETPVQGNAYVIPGTTVLHGTMTASYAVSGVGRDLRMEFFLDLATGIGTAHTWLELSSGTSNVLNGAMALGDCASLPVTGMSIGEGGQGFIDQ